MAKMRDDKRGLARFLPVVFMLYSLMVCLIFLYMAAYPRVVGNVIAQGGNYTELRITQSSQTDAWYGFYGNLTSSPGQGNMTFYGGDVTFIDIYSAPESVFVYASTVSNINWSEVTNATPADVDVFLGVGPADLISGTSVFTQTKDFNIEGVSITAHSTTTRSLSGTYELGLLKYNNTLIFVSHIVNGLSLDNKSIDFQFMVPVPSGSNLTYYFGSYKPGSQLNCTISQTFNLTLGPDNISVDIIWPTVAGASSYSVYHIDNLTDLMFNFSNATVVSGLGTNWTDPMPGTRYYRVAAVSGNGTCLFNMTGSRFEYDLYKDWNLISSPLLFKNSSVKEVFRSIEGEYTNVNEFDNPNQIYNYYIISGPTIFKNFDTIKPGNAYWVKADSNITLVTVGEVFGNLSYPLAVEWSLIGFPIITVNNTVPYVLSQINGTYTNINEFDNIGQFYNYYIVSGPTVFSNFDTIKPGLGYWIKVNANVTMNYTST